MTLDAYLRQLVDEGAVERYGERHAGDPRAHRRRADRHRDHGVRRLLPHRLGPDPVRPRARHPGGPGAGLGRRLGGLVLPADHRPRPAAVRADLRALPEPRAQADARHRHGLRRARPGPGHPVRGRRSTARTTSRRSSRSRRSRGSRGSATPRACWGSPPSMGDRLCKMYPPAVLGPRVLDRGRAEAVAGTARRVRDASPRRAEIVDTARALEGLRREDSVHAAGVVIGDAPLVNYLPLKLVEGLARRLAAHRHAVRHARRREARPAEDGLPRACGTCPSSRTRCGTCATAASSWTSTTWRWTTPGPTRCSAAATPIGVFQLEGAGMR